MAEIKRMIDGDGEVRELTAADLATFERGAPWAKLAEYQRLQRIEAAARKLLSKQDQPHQGDEKSWSRAEREELRDALNQ